jgi:EpsD family peptidyl-prolyl cis-trans isomerase
MIRSPLSACSLFVSGRAGLVILACVSVFLAGCGDKKDKPASQTAAKVNKEEITVHQINFLLQQRPVPPAQAASASRQILERLIDQELVLQQAREQKLDRDPQIVQQIEASRREIVARAYAEKIGSGATKPTAADAKNYYDNNPALFKERRVYGFQEFAIEASPDQLGDLKAKVAGAKDAGELEAYLKSGNFKFVSNRTVKAAEQLPLSSLESFSKMKDGQSIFSQVPNGAQVLFLVESRLQPVEEQRALPLIEQFLLNERKRKAVDDNLKALRSTAHVEYVGEFASGAPAQAAEAGNATPAAPTAAMPAASEATKADPDKGATKSLQ